MRDKSGADATTRRREHKSQRRSVRRDYAKTPPKLATAQRRSASQRRSVRRDRGRRDYAKTRTQVATSQHQTRLREDAAQTRSVTASQRQTRQREEGAETRNVAALQRQAKRQPVLQPHWLYLQIIAVTRQMTMAMEYAGKNAFSEARGKWKCPWNLPTLVINQ